MLFTLQQKDTGKEMVKEETTVKIVPSEDQTTTVVNHTPSSPQPNENEPPNSFTNDIIIDQGRKKQRVLVLKLFDRRI